QVNVLTRAPDGSLVIGGDGLSVSGVGLSGLARLSVDGLWDATLNSSVYGVTAIRLQPDGNLLVAGGFTEINGIRGAHVARIFGDTTTRRSVDFSAASYLATEQG